MGGGGGGGGDDARRMEEERQAAVEAGIAEVDKIFGGFEGMTANPAYAQYMSNRPDPSQYTTTQRVKKKNAHKDSDGYTWVDERVLDQAAYDRAMSQWEAGAPPEFTQTGTNLYDQYKKTYTDYYTPQLQKQGLEARTNIGFDAARKGMTESSAAIDREADFSEDYQKALTTLANQAQSAENQYRTNVANQKQNLYSQVQAGMDPTTAANLAQSTYNTLSAQTPELSPLGDLFSQYAQMSSMNMGLQGAGYPGMPTFGSTGMVNPFGSRGGTGSIK